jgi:hypothetical protein
MASPVYIDPVAYVCHYLCPKCPFRQPLAPSSGCWPRSVPGLGWAYEKVSGGAMDWHELLADVEAQAESWAERDRQLVAADQARLERRSIAANQRFAGSLHALISCTMRSGERLDGHVEAVGANWALLTDPHSHNESIIALEQVVTVRGMAQHARAISASPIVASLDLMWVLQRISRERSRVRCGVLGGVGLSGVIDQVGADYVVVNGDVQQLVMGTSIVSITRL